MNLKPLLVLFIILIFALSLSAQEISENLIEKTDLNFLLSADPTPQEAGFDNPKSFWKVKYELYLTDFSELEKLGICSRNEASQYICPIIKEKKLNKRIKKKSLKISKGNFTKKLLSDEANRAVVIPLKLQPNVIEIFNQATKIPERNPAFVLIVTEKISVRDLDNNKLKEKYSITGIKPLKNAVSNKTSEYWNIDNLSLKISVVKEENGRLKLVGGLIH